MALEMVLNELSLQPADDQRNAREWMSTFIQTVIEATSHHVSRAIRTESRIFDIYLAENYPLSRWLNDPEVDRAEKRYIRSLTTKYPFWDELPELYEKVLSSEFQHNGRIANGLGVAYLLEALAVSLPSEDGWDSAQLSLQATWITEEEGVLEEESVQVIHASQPRHVQEHNEWIQERLRQEIQDGNDLWNRRADLLPSLTFCEAVAAQIQELSPTMLRPVVRRLFQLQSYCQNWQEGGFDAQQLPSKATPESQATLNQYSKERTFLCPDNISRTFSWHVRLTPGAWRLYFFPGPEIGQIIIGYIGPHLPTVKHH